MLAGALVIAVIIVGATTGFGGPDLPDGDVAFVEDVSSGDVTQEEFDAALEQAAARQGIRQTPEPGTPQYDLLKESAMGDLLLAKWVTGEAEELGIEVTDREIDEELETIIQQQFGGQEEFDKFLEQQGFSQEDALERVELQLLSTRVQEQVLGTEPEVSDDEIETYYESNKAQFETPESRDVRTILNPDEAKAQQALEALQSDDSPASWKKVAKEFSTDEATAASGGLRQAVVEGQNDPALDAEIFSAPEGELVGPVETPQGFYVFQVTKVNAASTQELDEQTREQIRQNLAALRQQEVAADFQSDFLAKWSARTVCADDFLVDRCSNAPPVDDACSGDDEGEETPADPETNEPTELGCPAFVPSTKPVTPGTAGDFGSAGLPQGPITGEAPPPGALPIGTPGAPPGSPVPVPPAG